MECPHCHISVHKGWFQNQILTPPGIQSHWVSLAMKCPECANLIIALMDLQKKTYIVYPKNIIRKSTPNEVPDAISNDYQEACAVLDISPKASAALSRRCLQSILSDHGYTGRNLANQVDAALEETDARKALSPALRSTIDAIRNFGNFSAHPITEVTTQQVIPVEPHEAEFCLEIIEEMFDHYYVRPAKAAERKAALDVKLASAGKPASK